MSRSEFRRSPAIVDGLAAGARVTTS